MGKTPLFYLSSKRKKNAFYKGKTARFRWTNGKISHPIRKRTTPLFPFATSTTKEPNGLKKDNRPTAVFSCVNSLPAPLKRKNRSLADLPYPHKTQALSNRQKHTKASPAKSAKVRFGAKREFPETSVSGNENP